MQPSAKFSLLLLAVSLLGGCSYNGGDIGDPLHRKFHWLSFVAGDDIAATCQAGMPDRFRLVYNAIWEQQVRVYELDSVRSQLRVRVIKPGSLTDLALTDPLAAWKSDDSTIKLEPEPYDGLVALLADSGAFGPPAVGLELPSHSYYWSAATCRQGHFTFTGWAYPSAAFDAARFPARLFALDPNPKSVIPAGPMSVDPTWEYQRNRGAVTEFSLRVGEKGMVQ